MRGIRIAALVLVSFVAAGLFQVMSATTAVNELLPFGAACAGIGLLAAWRKPGR